MTKQEIFNTVYLGLASQGFERSRCGFSCMYRGDEGRKCAAGWLVPDEDYYPEMDGQGTVPHVSYFREKYDSDTLWFIKNLQGAHDMGETPDEMKVSLMGWANHYDLTVPEIPND